MPKLIVKKSIVIQKRAEDVFSKLNDFNQWNNWSPWNILEKGVQSKVSDNSKFFEWIGDVTGEGSMRIIGEQENKSVLIDLLFIKPFKSKAKVDFELHEEGDSTKVIWNMQSKIPFFIFFLKKTMSVMIGMDFERGLSLLKDVVEDGVAHCKLDFEPNGVYSGANYIGVHRITTIQNAPDAMKMDFEQLMEYTTSKPELINGNPLTIYKKWELVKGNAEFISAVPVSKVPTDLPSEFVSGFIPKTNTYMTRLTGPYRHLGNAWTAIEMHARAKKFKKNKSINPIEVYVSNPEVTHPNDLITEIHMAKL